MRCAADDLAIPEHHDLRRFVVNARSFGDMARDLAPTSYRDQEDRDFGRL
jgi:hypothetical protein